MSFKTLAAHIPKFVQCRQFFWKRMDCDKSELVCGPCSKFKYMDVRCKTAIVTGGATGIGFAIVNNLLCNDCYRVMILGVDPCAGSKAAATLNAKHGTNRVCSITMDVRQGNEFEEAISSLHQKFGGIDVLVNSAGVIDDNWWEDEIDINLKSVTRGVLLGMKYMSQRSTPGSSVIINVGSTLSFDSSPPYIPIYAACQHGIAGLTRSFGDKKHYNASGVRVVAICPGPTATESLKNAETLDECWDKVARAKLLEKTQSAESVGKAVIHMIQFAPTGSCWVVENGVLYKTEIPDRTAYQEKVMFV